MKRVIPLVIFFFMLSIVSCEKKEFFIAKEGSAAPDFVLPDLDGKKVSLSDLKGKIVVLDFWATWCHSCKETSQELERLHKKYKGGEVFIMGISMDIGSEAVQQVRDFMDRYDLTYPMLMGNSEVKKSYAVTKIPVTYLLNREHTIIKTYIGAVPDMEKLISKKIEEII
jgi:peroxiredoxin